MGAEEGLDAEGDEEDDADEDEERAGGGSSMIRSIMPMFVSQAVLQQLGLEKEAAGRDDALAFGQPDGSHRARRMSSPVSTGRRTKDVGPVRTKTIRPAANSWTAETGTVRIGRRSAEARRPRHTCPV